MKGERIQSGSIRDGCEIRDGQKRAFNKPMPGVKCLVDDYHQAVVTVTRRWVRDGEQWTDYHVEWF